jgi:hypothetical protein
MDVRIGAREIYDALVRLEATVGRLVEQYAETRAEVRDHEGRMRDLERGRWPLPALAALVSLAALAVAIIRPGE